MRRSICNCTPSYALAGAVGEWRFTYTTANKIPKGAKLKFDLNSDGRDIDWECPQAGAKQSENAIYGLINNETVLHAKEVESADCYTPYFEFTLPNELKEGEIFTIIMGPGAKSKKGPDKAGNGAQCFVQRRRPFLFSIDPKGNGCYDDPEPFLMDIRGNVLEQINVVTPSYVIKNKRFDVTIRFEDAYGNLTANAPEDTLIELTHDHLRDNLSWKIFVPETGFITLPNLYFNEDGMYTIQLRNMKSGASFRSAPIRCLPSGKENIYWGLLHGESERVDSTENVEACLRHFRDDRSFNFYATSPFESSEETSVDIWKLINQNVAEFNEPDRFVNMLGFQWNGDDQKEGGRQIIYFKDNKSILRKKEAKNNSLKKIYKSFAPNEALSIPTFTMGKGCSFDFAQHNPEFEKVVEIYNAWGSSECTEKEGNSFPIKTENRSGIKSEPKGSIRAALNNNCRFGFVGGGLDDRGFYGDLYDSGQVQYNPGLTAVIAEDQNRDSLLKGISERRCYATTGARMIVGFTVSGTVMGQEISTADKPGLAVNRHISGHVAGTENLSSIEIIRNGKVVKSFKPDGYSLDFTYDDMDPLKKVCLASPDKRPPFTYYYIRAQQKDGHMAWSSPIWVDFEAAKAVKK